jgi:hypothetical protein
MVFVILEIMTSDCMDILIGMEVFLIEIALHNVVLVRKVRRA